MADEREDRFKDRKEQDSWKKGKEKERESKDKKAIDVGNGCLR